MNSGVLYAALAYTAWGLFPIFFKQLGNVDAFEVVLHRMVWSLVFLLCVLAVLRRWNWLRGLASQPPCAHSPYRGCVSLLPASHACQGQI